MKSCLLRAEAEKLREELIEQLSETDENLLNAFLENGAGRRNKFIRIEEGGR